MAAWKGSLPNGPSTPDRIKAAAFQGKPVWFEIIGPAGPKRMVPAQTSTNVRIMVAIIVSLLLGVIAGGLLFALRNLRLGRGDRRNATRLAFLAIGLIMVSLILGAHHIPTIDALNQFIILVSLSIFAGCLCWVLYIAIEPFVRRRWPQVLISWTRLLSGDWRDPLVARDTLIGCAFGILLVCVSSFARYFVLPLLGYIELAKPSTFAFDSVLGIRYFISNFTNMIFAEIFVGLSLICLLFILRIMLRNQKAAFAAFIVIFALIPGLSDIGYVPISLVVISLSLFVLMRFGLVVLIFFTFLYDFFSIVPTTLDASAWYSGYGFAALAILAVIVLYAFRTSLGGRPLLASSHFDD